MATNAHPLADEIKRWADAPNEWQWQAYGSGRWVDCLPQEALTWHTGAAWMEGRIRLIPKRNMFPADRLPKGWEVERIHANHYRRWFSHDPDSFANYMADQRGINAPHYEIFELLRHIDPEASDD